MATRLSSLLVRDGVVDVGTMEQAFRRKDLEGGRLGMVLLELGAVDDITLQFYLSRALDLPAPSKELLASINDQTLGLLDVGTVLASGAIPAAVEGDALAVLVRDPLGEEAVELVESTVKRPIRQYVLPDFRFDHALADLYGVRPSERAAALIAKYPMEIGAVGMAVGESASRPSVAVKDDKIAAKTDTLFADVSTAWTSEQMGRFLAHARDRDEIVQALLGFAKGHFPRCVVLAVQHGQLRGFAGRGFGVPDERLRQIRLKDVRILRDAQARGGESVFIALPQDMGLSPLYDELELEWPTEVACFCLRVGARPALILAGDNEARPIPRTSIPAVEIAVSQSASALIRVVREKKKAQQTAEEEPPLDQTAPLAAVPDGDEQPALVELDAGWGFFESAEFDAIEPLIDSEDADEEESTVDTSAVPTDIEQVEDERQDTIPEGLLATGNSDVADGENDEESPQSHLPAEAESSDDLDDLMFSEIERLVLEDQDDDSEKPAEQTDTLLGIGGIGPADLPTADEPDDEDLAATQKIIAVPSPKEPDFAEPADVIEGLFSTDKAKAIKAKAELLLAEPEVLKALKARFPGPIRKAPKDPRDLPALAECGPLFEVVGELGQRFSSEIRDLMASSDRDQRYYATMCCAEIRHPENLSALTARLSDEDAEIRALATQVIRSYRGDTLYTSALERLRQSLSQEETSERAAAARALGNLGDVESIPALIELVGNEHDVVADSSQYALEHIVFQGFGPDKKKWRKWYNRNSKKSRIQWLQQSVVHKQTYVRKIVKAAVEESPDLDVEIVPTASRRELKRAQKALTERIKQLGMKEL